MIRRNGPPGASLAATGGPLRQARYIKRDEARQVKALPIDPWIGVALLLTGWLYIQGWRQLRRRGATRWQGRRLVCFLGGLSAIGLALSTFIDSWATLLLQVHMAQHLLADDAGAAPSLARRAAGAAAARPAHAGSPLLDRAAAPLAAAALRIDLADPTGAGLAAAHHRHLALALAAALRTGPARAVDSSCASTSASCSPGSCSGGR